MINKNEEENHKESFRKKKRQYARQLRKKVKENAKTSKKRGLERITEIETRLKEQGLLNTDLATLVSSVRSKMDIPSSIGVKGESKKETKAFIAKILSILSEDVVIELERLKRKLQERGWTVEEKFFNQTIEELRENGTVQTWRGLISLNLLDTSFTTNILTLVKKNGGVIEISELKSNIHQRAEILKKIVEFLCEKGFLVREAEKVYLPS